MIIELTDSATRATCAGVRCDWSLAELSCELSAVATASLINSTLTAADWPGGKPRKSNDNLHLKLNHVLPQFPPFFFFCLFVPFLFERKKEKKSPHLFPAVVLPFVVFGRCCFFNFNFKLSCPLLLFSHQKKIDFYADIVTRIQGKHFSNFI